MTGDSLQSYTLSPVDDSGSGSTPPGSLEVAPASHKGGTAQQNTAFCVFVLWYLCICIFVFAYLCSPCLVQGRNCKQNTVLYYGTKELAYRTFLNAFLQHIISLKIFQNCSGSV